MKRACWGITISTCALLATSTLSFGEGRLFLVPSGTGPGAATPGTNFPVTVTNFPAQYTITILVYADVNPNEELKATQVSLPCSIPCSGGGAVNFVAGTAAYDMSRTDDLLEGYPGAGFPATDQGTCGGVGGLPRVAVAMAGQPLSPPVPVMTDMRYVGQFQYQVENACVGTATIVVPNEPDSAMRDENNMPIIFTTDGMEITVPTGQCCACINCLGQLTYKECSNHGGTWAAGKTCADACGCNLNVCCNDGNACTNNICSASAGQCQFPSNVPLGQCCDPADGSLLPIEDNNECTQDTCNPQTGAVLHFGPPNDGLSCASDSNPCTIDRCGGGTCQHQSITSLACATDQDCVTATGGVSQSCGNTGFCECVVNPTLSIDCPGGAFPNPECHNEGETINLIVQLGASTQPINGAQFRLVYDPTCMDFVSIAPGSTCDEQSPFDMEIFKEIRETSGELFYAVGVPLVQNNGATAASALACLTFHKIGPCTECEVCFDDINPQHTLLSGPGGQMVTPDFLNGSCGCRVRTGGTTTITAPESTTLPSDCNTPTAQHTWSQSFQAVSSCGGLLESTCTCSHTNPLVTQAQCNALIAHGGEFPQGTAHFCCTAEDECGRLNQACWDIAVEDQTWLDVTVQLSPTMTGAQFTRCIEFGFFANCVESPTIFKEELTFGPPYDFPGHASTRFPIPKGQFACLTARDQVHTLRSVAYPECGADHAFHAEYKGDPDFGGNWLIGGNLDGSHVIDILDAGVVIAQYLKPGQVNIDCQQAKAEGFFDADINADGIVDALDYAFITRNMGQEDKNSCCPDPDGGSAGQPPIMTISVAELRARGLHEIAKADLNRDGVLDARDLELGMVEAMTNKGVGPRVDE